MATALAFEDLTVDDTARAFATDFGANPNLKTGFIQLDTAEIRYRLDGGTPTSTSGHLLAVGEKLWLRQKECVNFKGIRTGGTSGKIRATFGLRYRPDVGAGI